jgi:hypothetical protein
MRSSFDGGASIGESLEFRCFHSRPVKIKDDC